MNRKQFGNTKNDDTPSPDEECCGDQHHSKVHRHRGLKVERFEKGGGIGDEEQEEGGEVGGQQLVDQPPLEHYLHLQTIRRYA